MSQWLDYVRFGNGKNGSPAVSGVINSYATCSGASGQAVLTTGLSVSVGDIVLCHQSQGTGAGNWQLLTVKSTGSGNFTANENLDFTYGTGAQAVLVPQYTGGTLSGTVTGTSWNGTTGGIIALMANGDLTVSGALNAASIGYLGAVAQTGSNTSATQGEGTVGARGTTSVNANGNGGGGGASQPGISQNGGGGGGNATAGGTGHGDSAASYYGVGGSAVGSANLTTMTFGGGGGGGSNGGSGNIALPGGNGGSIIFIIAKTITVSGTVSVNGQSATNTNGDAAGSGGGAGGCCLIKCQTATIGTNRITASGGNGGIDTGGNRYGGNGSAGRIHIDYSDTLSGTTTPTLDSAQVTTLKSQVYGGMI